MKSIAIVILTLLLAGIGTAMPDTQIAYIQGLGDGFYLGELAWQARGNATAVTLYNAQVAKYNAWLKGTLNASEARLEELVELPMPDQNYLPQVLQAYQGGNPWAGTRAGGI